MKTKRVLSLLLAMLMCLTLLPAMAVSAEDPAPIEYIANADFAGAAPNTYEKAFGLVCKGGFHTAYSLATKVEDGVLIAQYDENAKDVNKQTKAWVDVFVLSSTTTAATSMTEDFTLSMQMKLIGDWTRTATDFAYVNAAGNNNTFSIADNCIVMKTASGSATSSRISSDDFSTVEFRFDFDGGVYVATELWVDGVMVGRNAAAGSLASISHFRIGTTETVGQGVAFDSIAILKGHHTLAAEAPVEPAPVEYIANADFAGAAPNTYEKAFGLVCKGGFHTAYSLATKVKDGVLIAQYDENAKTVKGQGNAWVDVFVLSDTTTAGKPITEDFTLSMRMSLLGNWTRSNTDFAYVNAGGNNNTFSVSDNCIVMKTSDGTASNGATVVAGTATSPRISSTRFSTVEFRFDFEGGVYVATELWVDGALVGRNAATGSLTSISHFRLGTTYSVGQGVAFDSIALVKGHHTLATEDLEGKYAPGVAASANFATGTYPTDEVAIKDFPRTNYGFTVFNGYTSKTTIENGALNMVTVDGKGQSFADFQFWNSTVGKMTESFTVSMSFKPIGTWNRSDKDFMNFRFYNNNSNSSAWQGLFYTSGGKIGMVTDNGNVLSDVIPTDSYTTFELMLKKSNGSFNQVSCYINGELLGTKSLTDEKLVCVDHFRMFTNYSDNVGMSVQSFSILNGNYSLYQAAQTATDGLEFLGYQERANDNNTLDLRFITGVKNKADYTAVANTIFVNGAATASFNGETDTVYTSILAEDPAGETTVITAADESVEGLYAAALRGIPTTGYYHIKVVSTATGANGTEYTNVYEYTVTAGVVAEVA